MFKAVRTLGAQTSRQYSPSFQLVIPRARRCPRVSTSSTARAGISHVARRLNSVFALGLESPASTEDAPPPISQDAFLPPALQSSSQISPNIDNTTPHPSSKTEYAVPRLSDEIDLPRQPPSYKIKHKVPQPPDAIGLPRQPKTRRIANKTHTRKLEAGQTDSALYKNERDFEKQIFMFDKKVSRVRRSLWGKLDIDNRPKSQFELDLRFNQDIQVLPTNLVPVKPPVHFFDREYFTDQGSKELYLMRRTTNNRSRQRQRRSKGIGIHVYGHQRVAQNCGTSD
jgi:hypothetical protein